MRAIIDGAERIIVVQPVRKEADVVSGSAAPMCLDDKTATEFVERETGRIRKEWFGSEHFRVKAGLQPQLFHRRFNFRTRGKVSSIRDIRINRVGVGGVVRGWRLGGKQRSRENK